MGSVVNVVLPIFGLILAGYIGRRTAVLGEGAASELNRFVVWFCLPSLLFSATATASWAALWHPAFIAVNVIATMGVFALTLGWRMASGQAFADASIDGLSAAYANVGYIGIPLCVLVLGDPGLAPALIATLVVVCVLFAIAVVCVEVGLQTDKRIGPAALKVLLALSRNPLVVAPVVGGVWAAMGWGLPSAPAKFLDLLGAATTPCALVSIGAFLAKPQQGRADGQVGLVGLKLLVHPGLSAILAFWVFDLPQLWAVAAVLLAALPTGTGPYMLADFYQREIAGVSRTILLTTIGSLITLSVCLYLLT